MSCMSILLHLSYLLYVQCFMWNSCIYLLSLVYCWYCIVHIRHQLCLEISRQNIATLIDWHVCDCKTMERSGFRGQNRINSHCVTLGLQIWRRIGPWVAFNCIAQKLLWVYFIEVEIFWMCVKIWENIVSTQV